MSIRRFNESDFPWIFDIYAKSKMDELIFEIQDFTFLPLEDDNKRLTAFIESDIYVYEDNGIVGYSALCGSEIRALFVHPDFRGAGIGKLMLKHLLSQIEGTAVLFVAKTNFPAKTLYEKFGFHVVDEFETTYNGTPVLANKMIRI